MRHIFRTSYCRAVRKKFEAISRNLLLHGASVNAKGSSDWFDYIHIANRNEFRTPLHLAASNCEAHTSILSLIMEQPQLDLNIRDEYGWTPLHWAAAKGNYQLLYMLLQKGLEILKDNIFRWVKMEDDKGNSALHCAAGIIVKRITLLEEGDILCAKILLQHGADQDALNHRAQSPLDLCKQYNFLHCYRYMQQCRLIH
jgi:ankyrin repeat protein